MSMYEHVSMDKIVCGDCGMEIPANSVYCPRCGAKRNSMERSSGEVKSPVNNWFSQPGDLDGPSTGMPPKTDDLAKPPVIKTGMMNPVGGNGKQEDPIPFRNISVVPPFIPGSGTDELPKEKARYCSYCGVELRSGAKFCTSCGKPCGTSGRDMEAPETIPHPGNDIPEPSKSISMLCVILLIGCAFFWLAAPFLAVDAFDYDVHPTAAQITLSAFYAMAEYNILPFDTLIAWAPLISIIGICLCFVSTLASAHGTTCFFATITEIPLVLLILELLDEVSGLDGLLNIFGASSLDFLSVFGIGFWGILIMLFIVICVSASKKLRE